MNFQQRGQFVLACAMLLSLAACNDGVKLPDDESPAMTKAQVTLSLHPGADTANGVHYSDEAPSFRYSVVGGPGLLPERSRLFITIQRGDGTARTYPPLTITYPGGSGELAYQWDNSNPLGNYTITTKLLGDEDKELAEPAVLKFRRVKR